MIDFLALVTAVVAILVAGAVYLGQSRRTDLESARQLHLDLTSGEVAKARQLFGTLRYGSELEKVAIRTDEALTAYFTILWCFERIAAGRRAILASQFSNRSGRALRFLDETTIWHLIEWRDGLPIVKSALAGRLESSIDDTQSRAGLDDLLQARGLILTPQ